MTDAERLGPSATFNLDQENYDLILSELEKVWRG